MKKFSLIMLAAILAMAVGCAAQEEPNQEEEIVYADNEVIAVLADGLESRFDYSDALEETTNDALKEVAQIEIDGLTPYRSRQFEDPILQEKVLAYLNILEEAANLAETVSVDDDSFHQKWQSLYGERAVMLKGFVDDYGLAVDEDHQAALSELVRTGQSTETKAATEDAVKSLVDALYFEKEVDEFGSCTYTAVGENTTELDLEDVSLTLALYDGEGVKAGETYANTSSWLRGEKVRFEAWSDIDAAEVKVSLEYYTVVE